MTTDMQLHKLFLKNVGELLFSLFISSLIVSLLSVSQWKGSKMIREMLQNPKLLRTLPFFKSNYTKWIFRICSDRSALKTEVWTLFPNSFKPISYFGLIWDLYVLDLINIFFRKENQLPFLMDKGLTLHCDAGPK